MSLGYLLDPTRQFADENGNPLAGGKITVYKHGQLELATTYSNFSGILNTNPIVLDSYGRCICIAEDGQYYDVYVRNANNELIYSYLNSKVGKFTTGIYYPGAGISIDDRNIISSTAKVYSATYGTDSYANIKDQSDNGSLCVLVHDGRQYVMTQTYFRRPDLPEGRYGCLFENCNLRLLTQNQLLEEVYCPSLEHWYIVCWNNGIWDQPTCEVCSIGIDNDTIIESGQYEEEGIQKYRIHKVALPTKAVYDVSEATEQNVLYILTSVDKFYYNGHYIGG